MRQRYLNSIAAWLGQHKHKLLVALLLVPAMTLLFLAEERVRGGVSLRRYVRRLKAHGEKMSPRDFLFPHPADENQNGGPEVLAAAKELNPGTVLSNSYPPRMKLTQSGHAVISFREQEWVEDKIRNPWEQLAKDLGANQRTLDRIQSALAKPVLDCEFDPTLGPHATFPHLSVPKTLSQWFASRVALGLHEGRTRETLRDLVTEIELPRMLARDGIVISELVRCAIAAIAFIDTWEALQAAGWTDDDLRQIQESWERQQFAALMVRALEGERIFAQSSYVLMRKSNKETVGVLYGMEEAMGGEPPGWVQTWSEVPGGRAFADFLRKGVYCHLWRFAWLDQDQLRYLRYLEGLIAFSRDAVREKSLQKIQPLAIGLALRFQNRGLYDSLRYPSVISVDSLSRVLGRSMRAETVRSLAMAAVALRRYKVRHGGLPQSLSELVPEFLPADPVDYMDGHSIRFRLKPDGGFLLYSVGEDGQDDGGDASLLPAKASSRVIWNRKDAVWPGPATEAEVEAYHAEAAKK